MGGGEGNVKAKYQFSKKDYFKSDIRRDLFYLLDYVTANLKNGIFFKKKKKGQ